MKPKSKRLLGLIEKVLVQDRSLGGNAIDFYTVGNAITMDLFTEKDIIGANSFRDALPAQHAGSDAACVTPAVLSVGRFGWAFSLS